MYCSIGGHRCSIFGDGSTFEGTRAFKLSAEAHEYENANFGVVLCLPPFVVQLLIKNYLDIYDASMQELKGHIQEHLSALLMDPSSIVKRAAL